MAGKFRFWLKAGNGEIIATGEAYESRRAPRRASHRFRKMQRTRKSLI